MEIPYAVLRTLFRGSRVLDAPEMLRHAAFLKLRRRYYDLFWANVAQETGATFRKWDGFHCLTRNGTQILAQGPNLRLDDHLTLKLMGNKAMTYELIAQQGFHVPRHVRFMVTDMTKAQDLLNATGRPLVVKPNSGTGGGRGVTTGIATPAALRAAALAAARFDPDLIAEEQVAGDSWRLLFFDGELLDAVRRDPPRILGDGQRSIRSLVKAENQRRLAGHPFTALSPIRLDRECRDYLAAQGLGFSHVPEKDQTLILKRAVNENGMAENHSLAPKVHAGTVAACAELCRNLGVRLAGIDIIARDISKPLTPENGILGEINTTPGLHHHDLIAERGAGPSIAARLVERMFETRSGVITLPGAAKPQPLLKLVGQP